MVFLGLYNLLLQVDIGNCIHHATKNALSKMRKQIIIIYFSRLYDTFQDIIFIHNSLKFHAHFVYNRLFV